MECPSEIVDAIGGWKTSGKKHSLFADAATKTTVLVHHVSVDPDAPFKSVPELEATASRQEARKESHSPLNTTSPNRQNPGWSRLDADRLKSS